MSAFTPGTRVAVEFTCTVDDSADHAPDKGEITAVTGTVVATPGNVTVIDSDKYTGYFTHRSGIVTLSNPVEGTTHEIGIEGEIKPPA